MRISDWSSDVCSSDLPCIAFLASFNGSRPIRRLPLRNSTKPDVSGRRPAPERSRAHPSAPRALPERLPSTIESAAAPPYLRPAERREGQEGVRPWSTRESQDHHKKKNNEQTNH